MTEQVADVLTWDRDTWWVREWPADCGDAVPSSEALGFRTTMASTACYRGRQDHLAIGDDRRLRIASMIVNLPPEYADFTPRGATRRVVSNPAVGSIEFRFDDLPVDLSGAVIIERDTETAELEFERGLLVAAKRGPKADLTGGTDNFI
ncbi:MAG: hypothetical protein AB7S36_07300 [Planctomycetota bacterium]